MSHLRRQHEKRTYCKSQYVLFQYNYKEYFVYFKGLRRGQGSKGTVSAEVEVPNGFY